MNGQDPRPSGVAPGTLLLGAGLVFVLGLAGWATPADKPSQGFLSSQPLVADTVAPTGDIDAEAALVAGRSDPPAATDEAPGQQIGPNAHLLGNRHQAHRIAETMPAAEDAVPPVKDTLDGITDKADSTEEAPALALPTGDAAPEVEVRVGDHREFERVVFEWPEAVGHSVVHRADRVVVAFGRPGRTDLSRLRHGFGRRVVEAWAEGGEVSDRIVLRLVPGARIRTFSLKEDRIVAIDVYGDAAAATELSPARRPEVRRTEHAPEAHVARPALPPSQADDAPTAPTGDATPEVEVRVGDHGAFERVVFEWPEAIEHDVVRRGDQVVVAFGRSGRIDLARLRGFGRRVLEARAEGGQITRRVVLHVLPDAEIRAFSLKDDRIVAIDVSGGTTPQQLARSAPPADPDPIPELRRALEQRDAVIADLLARVEHLERDVVLSGGDLDRVSAGGTGSVASPGDARLSPSVAPATALAQVPAMEPMPSASAAPSQRTAPEQATGSQGQGEGGANAAAKPGEFDVAEEDIDRALERTLVQTGALLLPFGQAEVEPYFSYTRREDNVPALFIDNGVPGLANQEVRRNEFVTGQTLRVGLAFDSQVELDLPSRYAEQSVVTPVGFGQREEEDGSGFGLGDLRVGLAKTLLRENGGWWPDLVARASWDTNTGETTANDVVLGGGFHELRGSLSAIKRQDPLAFVGGVSYEKTFENDDVAPGDEIGLSLGTVLAASPGTSLRLALDQSFISNTEVGGQEIDGSDRVVGTATFGASVVLGRGVVLDVAADIGLTDDAPDYAARASLPIRFNLPVY